jgi:hypothetical protein
LCLAYLTSHKEGEIWINIEASAVEIIPTADIQKPELRRLSTLSGELHEF